MLIGESPTLYCDTDRSVGIWKCYLPGLGVSRENSSSKQSVISSWLRLRKTQDSKAAETVFDLADEIHELWLSDDLRMPAEVAFDQVVGLDDMGAG